MADLKKKPCRLGLVSHDGSFPAEFHGVSPEGLWFSVMSLGGNSYIGPGGSVNCGDEFRWRIHCDYPGRPLEGHYVLELSREMVSLAACSHKSFQIRIYDAGGTLLERQKLSHADLDVNRTETFPDPDRAQAFITGDGSGRISREPPPEDAGKPEVSEKQSGDVPAEAPDTPPKAVVPEVTGEIISEARPPEDAPPVKPPEIPEPVPPAPDSRPDTKNVSGERFERTFRTGGYREPRGCSPLSYYYLVVLMAGIALAVCAVLSVF